MFAVQHLQRRRAELQEEYDSLSSVIRRLRESHAVETDPAAMSAALSKDARDRGL